MTLRFVHFLAKVVVTLRFVHFSAKVVVTKGVTCLFVYLISLLQLESILLGALPLEGLPKAVIQVSEETSNTLELNLTSINVFDL